MRYRTTIEEEVVGPFAFSLERLTSFEHAVDDMHAQLSARGVPEQLEVLCPYFGILWPGGRALARWIWEQGTDQFQAKRVLELGCGLALPSFVAARLGANTVASDAHPHVPDFLSRNLSRNPEVRLAYRNFDWNLVSSNSNGTYDWILASDILYESNQARQVLRFLQAHLAPSGRALIVDPDRSFWSHAVELARECGLRARAENYAAQSPLEPARTILIHLSLL